MNAQEAFIYFIKKALSPGKAERLTELAGTRKGRQKILPTIRDAYDKLSLLDGWLILLGDGSAGIYRPEGRWDDESLILS